MTKIGPREENKRDPSILEDLSTKSRGFGGYFVKIKACLDEHRVVRQRQPIRAALGCPEKAEGRRE